MYTDDVAYCDHCNNYSEKDSTSCEICGWSPIKNTPTVLDSAAKPPDEEYETPVGSNSNRHYRQMVYVPESDALAAGLARNLAMRGEMYLHSDTDCRQSDWHRPIQPVLGMGCKKLSALKEGGRLFITGHGNAGGAIGSHETNYGAETLVTKLLEDGLPRRPTKPVTIWLFACCTGVEVNPKYMPVPWYRKDSYVERFTLRLWNALYRNYYIVGFAGFVRVTGELCFDYIWDDTRHEERRWFVQKPAHRIVYMINDRGHSRRKGQHYVQVTDMSEMGLSLKQGDLREGKILSKLVKHKYSWESTLDKRYCHLKVQLK